MFLIWKIYSFKRRQKIKIDCYTNVKQGVQKVTKFFSLHDTAL